MLNLGSPEFEAGTQELQRAVVVRSGRGGGAHEITISLVSGSDGGNVKTEV